MIQKPITKRLTKREYVAFEILKVLLSNPQVNASIEYYTTQSIYLADRFLKELRVRQ